MKKAEVAQCNYLPAKEIDKAVNEMFGQEVQCNTFYDLLGSMQYVTTYKAEGELKARIDAFIQGWKAGNRELAERLQNPGKFLN